MVEIQIIDQPLPAPRPQRGPFRRRYSVTAHTLEQAAEELAIMVQNSMSLKEAEELGIDPSNWEFKGYEQPKSQIAYLIDSFWGLPSDWVFYVTFKRLEG